MSLRYDLHSHSTRSDGLLSPADVVRRAASRGVDVLALTDHDETSGLAEAAEAADVLLARGVALFVRSRFAAADRVLWALWGVGWSIVYVVYFTLMGW